MHDKNHEYDDNCAGCQPAYIPPVPDDHPLMKATMYVWRNCLTLEGRKRMHAIITGKVPPAARTNADTTLANWTILRVITLVDKYLMEGQKI